MLPEHHPARQQLFHVARFRLRLHHKLSTTTAHALKRPVSTAPSARKTAQASAASGLLCPGSAAVEPNCRCSTGPKRLADVGSPHDRHTAWTRSHTVSSAHEETPAGEPAGLFRGERTTSATSSGWPSRPSGMLAAMSGTSSFGNPAGLNGAGGDNVDGDAMAGEAGDGGRSGRGSPGQLCWHYRRLPPESSQLRRCWR